MDGVGDYTSILAQGFIQKGYSIDVLCSNKPEINSIQEGSLRVYPLISKWNQTSTGRIIKKIIKLKKPDFIVWQFVPHGYQKYGLAFRVPVWVKLCNNYAPTYVFFHEVRIKINWTNPKSILLGLPMKWIAQRIKKNATSIATSNPGYKKLLGKEVSVFPIPSNISVSPLSEGEKAKTKLRLGINEQFVIGTFGQGVRGQNILLEAIRELSMDRKDFHLHLIGGIRKEIKEEIQEKTTSWGLKDKISFSGYLPEQAINQHLGILDIYLMLEPSHSKSTWTGTSTRSGTLAAAFAAGLPVIGVKGELTSNELEGNMEFISRLEVDAVKKAILQLMETHETRKLLSKNAFAFFKDNLSINKNLEKYITWFEG